MRNETREELEARVGTMGDPSDSPTASAVAPSSHSALPWFVTVADGPDDCYTCGIGSGVWIIADMLNTCSDDPSDDADHELARANAAHIVRCVNVHDELLAAHKRLAAGSIANSEALLAAHAAIAKAEGH